MVASEHLRETRLVQHLRGCRVGLQECVSYRVFGKLENCIVRCKRCSGKRRKPDCDSGFLPGSGEWRRRTEGPNSVIILCVCIVYLHYHSYLVYVYFTLVLV